VGLCVLPIVSASVVVPIAENKVSAISSEGRSSIIGRCGRGHARYRSGLGEWTGARKNRGRRILIYVDVPLNGPGAVS
jgi:hypothetical protein